MKILHVCETAKGGIATYFRLFDNVAPAGVGSVFLVPERQACELGEGLSVRTHRGGRTPKGLRAMIRAMHLAIAEERPDVVFFHSSFSLLALFDLTLGMRRKGGMPTLYCPHGWSVSRLARSRSVIARILRMAESHLASLATRIVNISAHDARLAATNGYRGRHVVIENAVGDRPAPAGPPPFAKAPGEIHLLFVGRFDRQKGVDLLVEAFEKASAKRPELRLHLVGGKVLGDQSLALPPSAHHVGWIGADRIDSWYAAADALIVPSRWEGFGLVVPEAYRNGTPVLVSRCGALPDLVEEGVTGKVFALDAIEETLMALDSQELAAMRPAARALFERRFGAARWGREFAALLQDITGTGR